MQITCQAPIIPTGDSLATDAPVLIVTGNPNVGKSVVFHWLTGRYSTVSNYPGTTVTISEGRTILEGQSVRVHDTPGINSLLATSEDEVVTRRLLLNGHRSRIVQVADAKNVERALALTLELAEAEMPVVLDLNMIDEARERRITIDADRLSQRLGIPVIPTIATQRVGLDRLRRAIAEADVSRCRVSYPSVIQNLLEEIEAILPSSFCGRRALALLWISGDADAQARVEQTLDPEVFARLRARLDEVRRQTRRSIGVLISEARLRAARELLTGIVHREPVTTRPWLHRLGDWALQPVWGSLLTLAVLAAMYWLVGVFGAQTLVGALEETVFGRVFNPAVTWAVNHVMPIAWVRDLLVGEYGLVTMALTYSVAIILPIVGIFFLCFGLLEDVGYLPRLAVFADRACRLVGLNGKAVLPLVLGLGCDTMATMTARTLDTKRDQLIVTLLLALAIPCSAQLGVILAMLSPLPPMATALWLGVVLVSFVAAGQAASRILGGERSPFLYEIPPLRWPKLSNIVIKTLGRVEWYLREAVPLFFLGTLILFVLDRTGLLSLIERVAAPVVVHWLGLPLRATEALLVGFLRRDFGAAGFFALQREGLLTPSQVVVSLVTITLFVPCFAQYLMMVKERGWKMATALSLFIVGYAVGIGGIVRWAIQHTHLLN
ncbi:MAG: ferrous iron transport protein B [Candidatus Omnitrophica bacterium]|nr:ferrous iron transport protein B [Candidatus Omnitrophota bacterium]